MTLLTLILIALFLTAWKAPAWVKEVGNIAAVFGIFASLIGFMIAAKDIAAVGDISRGLIWGSLSVAVIPTVYGLLIYIISLIIRIVQKPRI